MNAAVKSVRNGKAAALARLVLATVSVLGIGCGDDGPTEPEPDRVHVVPTEFSTIQAAIDASENGDTVRVEPGIYQGAGNSDLVITERAISLIGAGSDSVIIDAGGLQGRESRGIWVAGGLSGIEIVGITVRNAFAYELTGGGLYCTSNARVMDCVFENCRAENGGGMYISSARVDLIRVRCVDCSADGKGGGIFIGDCVSRFDDVECTSNRARDGGGVFVQRGVVVVAWGLGLCRNTALWSQGGDGGGAYVSEGSLVGVATIVDNRAGIHGGGVFVNSQGTARLVGSTIAGNTCEYEGGGIYTERGGAVEVNYSIVWGNCSLFSSQVHVGFGAGATVYCSDVDSTGVGGGGSAYYWGDTIFDDPQFCSPAPCGDGATGDYRVRATSPCRPERNACGLWIGALEGDCP